MLHLQDVIFKKVQPLSVPVAKFQAPYLLNQLVLGPASIKFCIFLHTLTTYKTILWWTSISKSISTFRIPGLRL